MVNRWLMRRRRCEGLVRVYAVQRPLVLSVPSIKSKNDRGGDFSALTRYGQREKHAPCNHEQIREFCQFLAHEWGGNRQHSYAVPSRGKSRAWFRTVDGKWSVAGLADAASKYTWLGKNFTENKAEFDRLAADLQCAVQCNSNSDVCTILRTIMHWGGADNSYRQKGTFDWIERNADEISAKLSNVVDLIKERTRLARFV